MIRYSQKIKDHVKSLRLEGWSLGKLEKEFHIPRTTIHSWISDIMIPDDLKEKIRIKALASLQQGRIKAQKLNKEKNLKKKKKLIEKGVQEIGYISERELFIAGITLYWAEGFKNRHEHRLGFCNSDPHMIRFYLYWLEKCLFIKKKDLVARLTLNRVYEKQTKELEKYWSQVTGMPQSQFAKPFYQNTKWKKQYNQENYHGVLRIHVKDSLEYLLEMKGWIEGLKLNLPG